MPFRVFRISRGSRHFTHVPTPLPDDNDTSDKCRLKSRSNGDRLKTPLLNQRMRNLPGLKPTLRFLDRGVTNARAIRGHIIPRYSAFFRGQHTHTQNNLFCPPVHNIPVYASSLP